MLMMASFSNISLSPPFFSRSLFLSHRFFPSIQSKTRQVVKLRVSCLSDQSDEPEPEPKTEILNSSTTSTYNWSAGIGAVGFIETAYLSYLKLTNSEAFCPIGGGTCGDVLNSEYALVFGIPLPLIGILAYGLVATLGLQLARKNLPFGISEDNGRLILLGTATSMVAASTYFLYILSTSFPGASCSYCLFSALLSFTLYFVTIKNFGSQEILKAVGLQLSIAGLVVSALSTSYGTVQPVPTSMENIDLKPFIVEITTQSSPFAVSLAKHLHSVGAKMYGAFWCSHCVEQKQMFGSEAAKMLDYVECFPDGYRKGTKIDEACSLVGIEDVPTWVINGQKLSGAQELTVLAEASGFNLDAFSLPS